MENESQLVTLENYRAIHAHIDDQIEHFLVNAETWTLSRFRKIPLTPDQANLVEMQQWIDTYLPDRAIRELTRLFGESRKSEPA